MSIVLRRWSAGVVLVLCGTLLAACQQQEAASTESGLQYEIIEAGSGPEPETGDFVSVHYRGMLEDSTVFDESYGRGAPITFPIGYGCVIPGWEEGIALLSEGAEAQLTIPPDLAYGEQGRGGVIPPNATLTFDVELVDVEPGFGDTPTDVPADQYTERDQGLQVYDLQEGDGMELASGQPLQVHYKGWVQDGEAFDSSPAGCRPAQFVLGRGMVIPGWDQGLEGMRVGGRRQLVIPPALAYGEEGAGDGIIPPNATLVFEIELLDTAPPAAAPQP